MVGRADNRALQRLADGGHGPQAGSDDVFPVSKCRGPHVVAEEGHLCIP